MILLDVLEPRPLILEGLLAMRTFVRHSPHLCVYDRFLRMPNFFLVIAWAFSDLALKFMRGCFFAHSFWHLVSSFRYFDFFIGFFLAIFASSIAPSDSLSLEIRDRRASYSSRVRVTLAIDEGGETNSFNVSL